MKLCLGDTFGTALCKHLGINDKVVMSPVILNASANEILQVTLNVALTADDIEAIGKIMKNEVSA